MQQKGDTNLNRGSDIDNSAHKNGQTTIPKENFNITVSEKNTITGVIEKPKWNNEVEFLMSCIAMSVGLGNIWRFPFTAYQNGGGAFLIPYIIVLALVGRPLYYLEMSLGQFTSKGNVKTFEALAAGLKGIGYCQILSVTCVVTYYSSLLALTVFYFVNSFTTGLPWSYCRPEWDEENKLNNITCVPSKETRPIADNLMSSSELYFRREVLRERTSIDNGIGIPDWRLTLCLALCWFTSFLIIRRGMKSSGKASYFLALFPYVIMLTLLGRAATLEGAANGMFYFVNPDWSKLGEPQVWYAAATQCFFSLNVGFGNIISYASYNKFTHNIHRDSIIITVLDTCTSMICGATIFGILGHLAFKLNVDVSEVINSGGTGLAFISYPEAIAKFDAVPWLFALLFFFMLFVVGMGSLVSIKASIFTILSETFPYIKTWKISLTITIAGFLISLIYVTPGGQFLVDLIDHFGGTFTCFVANIVVICLISWFYGLAHILDDIEYMTKRKQGIYWRLSWGIITPLVLMVIFIYFVSNMTELKHEGRDFPRIVLGFGWAIVGLAAGQIPLWFFVYCCRNRKLGFKTIIRLALAHINWGPANINDFEGWKAAKEEKKFVRSKQSGWLAKIYYVLVGKSSKPE